MKKVVFIIASVLLLTGCSKELGLPTVKLLQDGITADKDHCTINIKAAVTDQGSSDVHDFGICYTTGSNNHPTVSDPHLRLTSDNMEAMEALLENAEDGTYYFRAYATNGEGTAYSDIVRFSFSANTYRVTVSVKVLEDGSGEDVTDQYASLRSFYNGVSYNVKYGETCTVALPPNTVISPEVTFSHAVWNDGADGRSHVITSDMECTMYFSQRDIFAGSYRCTATNVATGQSETWTDATYNNHVFQHLCGGEGLNMKITGPVWDGVTYYAINHSTTFTNADGVECLAQLYAYWDPNWEDTPVEYIVETTNILHLAYVSNGRWVLNGGAEQGYDKFFWKIVNAATEEEIARTPIYTNLELTKIN